MVNFLSLINHQGRLFVNSPIPGIAQYFNFHPYDKSLIFRKWWTLGSYRF